MAHQWRGIIEEYRERLPVTDATPVVTLREGGTPLVRSDQLSEQTGCEVWLKFEGANPTGSFKDRGMTLAFEVCDALGAAPAYHCVPVGNAGNISSHWIGYSEYVATGLIPRAPQLFGFQAAGAAPIVKGHPVAEPSTIATAIRIGNPASWELAEKAAAESGGEIRAVTDREILRAYRMVARQGLFAELASSASVAGLLSL